MRVSASCPPLIPFRPVSSADLTQSVPEQILMCASEGNEEALDEASADLTLSVPEQILMCASEGNEEALEEASADLMLSVQELILMCASEGNEETLADLTQSVQEQILSCASEGNEEALEEALNALLKAHSLEFSNEFLLEVMERLPFSCIRSLIFLYKIGAKPNSRLLKTWISMAFDQTDLESVKQWFSEVAIKQSSKLSSVLERELPSYRTRLRELLRMVEDSTPFFPLEDAADFVSPIDLSYDRSVECYNFLAQLIRKLYRANLI